MTQEHIEIEGMRLVAPQPAELCYICGDAAFYYDEDGPLCPWHYGTRLVAPQACPICGGIDHCDCDEDYVFVLRNTPLLAQCAALLTRCADLTTSMLGGPVATHGLIDEIRRVHVEIERVRAELAKAGW